jgi:hypothetical protein
MQRLAIYSQERLFTADLKLEYDRSDDSWSASHRTRQQVNTTPVCESLRDAGCCLQGTHPKETQAIEGALNPTHPCSASIHLPNDEVVGQPSICITPRE